jgi:AraC-like DNA-binding protein
MAAILYTSGSTGRPKGVVLSHRNMVAGAKSVASYLGNHSEDTLLAALPLSFDAGFSQLSTAFHAGARVVHHFFVHFLAGAPYDDIVPHIFALPIDAEMRGLIQALTAPIATDPPALTRRESFILRALIYLALAKIPEHLWPAPQTDERVIAVLRFIEKHYDQHLTNAEFAAIASMSPKAFVRVFKEKTQQTPLAYLLQRRLARASILLHHTDESIERIAERCGFYDRHHFSKLFQRKFNVGPATYRKTRML